MSALSDVARMAGVSKSTASRALSGSGYVSAATKDKVVQAAAAIGYVVSSNAASLVTGQTRNVGVVVPYINRWFFAEVLEGIQAALINAGYDLTLYRLSPDPDQRRRVFDYFLVRKRVDAVIAVSIALTTHEVQMLHSLGKPIVGIGGPITGTSTLSIDDVEVARLATDHLLGLGHTRIMHLGGDLAEQIDFSVHEKRLAGFRAALESAGVSVQDDFLASPFSIPGGYEAALSVLANPRTRPTAIVAGCDEIAIGIMIAARQLGIHVPTQLSVVGIDDHDLAAMFGLTTVRQCPRSQGTLAVEIMMRELSKPTPANEMVRHLVPTTFKVRTSTTAPPA
ncbi:LacI family transcriptional regulator [Cryobacterium sp. Hh7]|uniref:LacI family DNA-binding transcriptional regulator n=1 Tax=Cryobacterium sp. Hh7 TaxID=1259159 RepID=UPI00106994ED|nr:LacI family DNA-binding transcriptional regulator [Cryobacterium sp. Hh7]TFD55326.1 LacI family transcriptional regulator [Cryobacterium sp. Hh7]